MTSVVYDALTTAHVLARDFWPLRLYAAEPRFVRLNVSVWLTAAAASAAGDGATGAAVGLYARRGAFPSHTRYDIFHSVDVDRLKLLKRTDADARRDRRHATTDVRTHQTVLTYYCILQKLTFKNCFIIIMIYYAIRQPRDTTYYIHSDKIRMIKEKKQ